MSSRLTLGVSVAALLVALLGTTSVGSALSSALPRNSVGPLQLKRNAVGPQKVAPNAIRAGHVLNGSLLVEDFKAGQIPAGPKGDKGDAGPAGPPGLSQKEVVFAETANDSTQTKSVVATCPAGKQAIAGGGRIDSASFGPALNSTRPQGTQQWFSQAYEVVATNSSWKLTTYVVCARVT